MSQTPPLVCVACNTVVESGTRFCPNCGTAIPPTAPMAPTVISSSGERPPVPTVMAPSPGVQNEQLPPPGVYNSSASHPDLQQYGNTPARPGGNAHTQYNTPPPPPSAYASASQSAPSDPYGMPVSNDPYRSGVNYAPGTFPDYAPSAVPPPVPAKKRSPLAAIIIGIVVVILAACGGGSYLIIKASEDAVKTSTNNISTAAATGGNSTGSTGSGSSAADAKYSASTKLNLSFTYASVLITVTKIEQAHKFTDDNLTTYSFQDNANYVRISFSEQQNAKDSSYFTYQDSIHLILPNKTTVTAQGEQQDSGPDHSVSRTNWMDFPITGRVDLNKLTLQVGSGDEAQMSVPLKNSADLSAYKDKTITPNKAFSYAGMDWTLKDATQSLSYDGKQAKTGQVYVVVDLVANNNSQSTVYLSGSDFARLKVNGTSVAPDYSSSADHFYSIDSNTTNVTGTLVFLTNASSNGTYTLDFQSGDNIQEQTVDFSFS